VKIVTPEEDAKAKEALEAENQVKAENAENAKKEAEAKNKVESSFVKEDSKPPTSTPTGSFAKEKKAVDGEKEHVPTMGEVMLYLCKETHEINVKLATVMDEMKKRANAPAQPQAPQPAQPQAPQPAQPQAPQIPSAPAIADDVKLVKIKVALAEYASMLDYDATSSNLVYIIKAKQFLGSDNFAKIAGIVRNTLGGQYVSQGKNSHFEISKAS